MTITVNQFKEKKCHSVFMKLFKFFRSFHEIQTGKASIKVTDSLPASWCLNYDSTISCEIDILFQIYKLFLLC